MGARSVGWRAGGRMGAVGTQQGAVGARQARAAWALGSRPGCAG